MNDSLEPVPSVRIRLQPVATSLTSGATAHTVKPSIAARAIATAGFAPHANWKIFALAVASACFGLGGAATLSRLRSAPAPIMQIVSGSPQLKKGSDGESVRWHSKQNKVYFDASLDRAGPHAREAVQLGFGTWLGSGAHLPSVAFDSTHGATFGKESNGKSEVMYGPITLAGHENDLALTVTFSDPKTGAVVESDMIFNSKHPFGVLAQQGVAGSAPGSALSDSDCQQRYDLQSVATHEAGHFFGLGEDFDAKFATMYYTTGRCETNKRLLQTSDETTMNALYQVDDASASSEDPSAETARGCGAHIGQGRTGGSLPSLSLLCAVGFVALRRVRRNKTARV